MTDRATEIADTLTKLAALLTKDDAPDPRTEQRPIPYPADICSLSRKLHSDSASD